MKVHELIKLLSEYAPEAEIGIYDMNVPFVCTKISSIGYTNINEDNEVVEEGTPDCGQILTIKGE